jgi:hypothetical protein
MKNQEQDLVKASRESRRGTQRSGGGTDMCIGTTQYKIVNKAYKYEDEKKYCEIDRNP